MRFQHCMSMNKIKYKDLWRQPRGKVGLRLSNKWLIIIVFMMYWGFFRNGIVPYILKATGEEIEAVVTGIPRIGGRSPHPLRYKFTKDGHIDVS